MMISPDGFIEQYNNKSYAELLAVRDELLNDIHSFERQDFESERYIYVHRRKLFINAIFNI